MKILHISHGGLPDPRIEKTAMTMKKEGHQLIFLGGKSIKFQNLDAFEETYTLLTGNDLDVTLNPFIKRKWLRKIREIRPDVIHAHNITVGHFLLGTDFPAIYDDHEYWSKQTFMFRQRPLPRGLASWPFMYSVPRWETKLLRKYPTLTTTENTAKEHRRKSRWVGVTRNVPMLSQVENLIESEHRSGIVYVGKDFDRPRFSPHRNMQGIKNYVKFDVVCGLPYKEMLQRLMKYKVGLTPWKPHPWHPYSDANRNYDYLHTGLQVIVNEIMKKMFASDPYIHSFKTYSEISQIIDDMAEVDSSQIMQYARKHYIWENQEDTIHQAYRIALA